MMDKQGENDNQMNSNSDQNDTNYGHEQMDHDLYSN